MARKLVSRLLVSPDFLFRKENRHAGAGMYQISNVELANRLSYFIWGSMPDKQLMDLAIKKKLFDDKVLNAQVKRMLKDPRSISLAKQFAGQAFKFRDLADTANPDKKKFPHYTDQLRNAMIKEAELFFDYLFKNDRPITEIIDARYSFLNESLAKHYGLYNIKGNNFRKVDFKTDQRGGIITMASTLTYSSYPQRSSPVLRGAWILENIIGAPTPAPPDDVPELEDNKKVPEHATLREKLKVHRENPVCASCHNRLDPPGFSLSNFDATGRWISKENGKPIDASAVMADGTKLSGPGSLKKAILKNKAKFMHHFSNRMLAYALGRSLDYYDYCTVKEILLELEANRYQFSALVQAVARSKAFQYRRGSEFKELAE